VDLLLEATYRAEQRHFWFRGFRRFVAPLIADAARGRGDLLVLDCGCGTGANLALLEPCGCAIGIDLTMRGLEFAKTYGRRRLARADAARLPFPDDCFDLVTSFDVIYSLDEDAERRALREMTRVLRPGGALLVNVAALPILKGNHSVLALERRRYTRAMLRERLEGAGLRVSRLTYTNAVLFPLMLSVRLAQRALGFAESERDAGQEISVPPAPVNALLAWLLGLEALVLRHVSLPFGSSLLALAWKPAPRREPA
jgi:SAM-dependent methyltransferase